MCDKFSDPEEHYATPISSQEDISLSSIGSVIPTKLQYESKPRVSLPLPPNRGSTDVKGPCSVRAGCDGSLEVPQVLIGVINAGPQTVSFTVFSTPDFAELATFCEQLQVFSPQDGWYEIDAVEVMDALHVCCAGCCTILASKGYRIDDIETIGVTNQRESTVVWHAETGQPLYRIVAWNDERTIDTVKRIVDRLPNRNAEHFKLITGLPVSPQFPALKIKWLQDHVVAVKQAVKAKKCKVGTLDSWIIWNLTKGSLHITDVTNASRTLLMNINTLAWEPELLKAFNISADMLPQIRSCSEVFGKIQAKNSLLRRKLLTGIIGNQQASLVGQMCLKPGQTNCNYRTNCFVTCNTGTQQVHSSNGLLTTIAYKMGPQAFTIYALEGAIVTGGCALDFLQSNVRILPDTTKAEDMAQAVPDTGDVYFVPAFSGLYAPYWCQSARGLIVGLTQFTTKDHIVRSALEAICFQVCDIMDSICKDSGLSACKFYADGILANNKILMQLQSDLSGVPVLRSQLKDTTAFGAALCAAHALNVDLSHLEPNNRNLCGLSYETFLPNIDRLERVHRHGKWKRAIRRSIGWMPEAKPRRTGSRPRKPRRWLLGVIPLIVFLLSVLVSFWLSASDEHSHRDYDCTSCTYDC